MQLEKWAIKNHVSMEALDELREMFGMVNTDPAFPAVVAIGSEGAAQSMIRLEASKKGLRLWRNNVGVAHDENGVRCLRYGLANDSKQLNEIVKSSDLIGIRKIKITPDMVGTIIGQFVAREVKAPGWVYKETKREKAQLTFLELITAYGGDAGFATGEGTL